MVLLPSPVNRKVTNCGMIRGRTWIWIHAVLLLWLLVPSVKSAASISDCEKLNEEDNEHTCLVDRTLNGPIKVIVHGTESDPFWQQVKAGMTQTAEDVKIDLDMVLFDDQDPTFDASRVAQAMAQEIRKYRGYANGDDGGDNTLLRRLADLPPRPAAIIVSLPGDSRIHEELERLRGSKIPIFGINAIDIGGGSDPETPLLLEATVSMNETQAGVMAGTQIRNFLTSQSAQEGVVTGLYINHRQDVDSLTERFDALVAATEDVVESWEVFHLDTTTTEGEILAAFEGCKDTVIQFAGGSGTAERVMPPLMAQGCNIYENHVVGTFDTSTFIYNAISDGAIHFAISQQPYLQGSNAVLLASLYANTGQTLTHAEAAANVQTGPILVTAESRHFPQPIKQVCEAEGFPVCSPYTSMTSEPSECPCTDRSEISITVLTHDESSDFWDTVFSGISQAASDFGVLVEKNRFKQVTPPNRRRKEHGEPKVSRLKHTFDINEACQSRSTHGLIVSIPDESMAEGLAGCASRGIPYLALNAVSGLSGDSEGHESSSFLQYIGQKDYESGLEAGRRLIKAGVKQGWCLVHANFDTINERCRGMETAFDQARSNGDEVEFSGTVKVPSNDDIPLYKKSVEKAIGKDIGKDDWNGIGVLSTGKCQIPALLSMLEDHPEMLAGTYDFDSALYDNEQSALSDQIVFSIDQNAYMEGYLSVASMVWKISTMETSLTKILETGPNFIAQPDISSDKNVSRRKCGDKSIKFCGRNEKEYEEQPLKYNGKCAHLGRPCGVCEGDCDDDTQCGEGLVCFVRDSLTSGQAEMVPGCNTNPMEWTSKDFCVDERVYQCKDVDWFPVNVGNMEVQRTCDWVAGDKIRCKGYGKFCRETCGYCRGKPRDGPGTEY